MTPQQTFSNAPVFHKKSDSSLAIPSMLKCNSALVLHKIPRSIATRKKNVQTNKTMVEAMVVSESEFNEAVMIRQAVLEDEIDEGAVLEDEMDEGAVLEDEMDEGAALEDDIDDEYEEDEESLLENNPFPTEQSKEVHCFLLALNCGWRIHSSRLPDGVTWAIKSIKNSEHTCGGLDERNPLVTVKWAAEKLMEDIRANNDISRKTLNDLLFSRYGVHMATSTLYKMKGVALKEINGGHDTSYGNLPKYCEMAAIDGVVAGCRSLVGVDEAHLKGHFGGVLLSDVVVDGNNELFPFAWAIVPKEDGDSWKYFFWHLKHILSGSGKGE
ncbi:uncharacterized protein LOC110737619 [Chenopodium quinoa]|uniref:uncharacterized protein LOC110737619 n=1 Tax=Chenopodium quinoa TaxID=63459 RepID=UPI000B780E35|nr:uncharacterized protein LOC110737619 [Chenopodium quinoa]